MILRKPHDVVADVRRQTTQAEQLAGIPGQHRLTDPRTNPAVRPLADALLTDQQRQALKAAHSRAQRRLRVEHRRAADAERALTLIMEARQAASPQQAVVALDRGRRVFMGASIAGSLALSYGAAAGVAMLAVKLGAPWQAGWVAEAGMSGLSTAVILYRSHLARYTCWEELTKQQERTLRRQDKILWVLMLTPLLASMIANAFGAGVVGIFCSIGAAACATFAHLVASMSASALHAQAARITDADERELHAIAVASDPFARPAPQPEEQEREPADPPVREPGSEPRTTNQEVRELEAGTGDANHEPRTSEPVRPVICPSGLNVNLRVHEPEGVREPGDANAEPRTGGRTTRGTSDLTSRAARKAAEVQQVLDLIQERGVDVVTLDMVRQELGLKKTTAYHRLRAARELFADQVAQAS